MKVLLIYKFRSKQRFINEYIGMCKGTIHIFQAKVNSNKHLQAMHYLLHQFTVLKFMLQTEEH